MKKIILLAIVLCSFNFKILNCRNFRIHEHRINPKDDCTYFCKNQWFNGASASATTNHCTCHFRFGEPQMRVNTGASGVGCTAFCKNRIRLEKERFDSVNNKKICTCVFD